MTRLPRIRKMCFSISSVGSTQPIFFMPFYTNTTVKGFQKELLRRPPGSHSGLKQV
jgi:hypothetical protein